MIAASKNTMGKLIPLASATAICLTLAGCSSLPHAGPSAGSMRKSDAVEVVRATPQLAGSLADQERNRAQKNLAASLSALANSVPAGPFRFSAGDTVKVSVWSYAGPGNAAAISAGGTNALGSSELGSYNVSEAGSIELPFLGTCHLAGMTLAQAQADLSRRFAALHTLARPSVVLTLQSSQHYSVLITGAIGQPKLVPWTLDGLTLASALTQAMGNGANIAATSLSVANPSQSAEVLRKGLAPVELPLSTALESNVILQPGDRVIVRNQANLRVTVLGGGITKPGVYSFGGITTLAQLVAVANGLNSNTGNTHGVYILRQRGTDKPQLFDFAWNRIDGLISSQKFPLHDGDIVYVGEAPFTEVSKVLSAVYSVAVPVQIAR